MAIISRILLLAAALPFVLATSTSAKGSSCSSKEFYFKDADCCVTRGGNPNPPPPPQETKCPTNGWDWHSGKSCCVPHQPDHPSPQCPDGWSWTDLKCVKPRSPPPTPTPSKPNNPTNTPPASTPSKPSGGNCGNDEFYFGKKDCCLPHGGQPNPPSPPKGTQCPPSGWSWHSGKGCCVPHNPPEQNPPPQCPKGWDWNDNDLKCYPTPPTTTPPPSKPSQAPGKGNSHYKKRHIKSRSVSLCPSGTEACPISGLMGLSGDYECLDTAVELTSCGGCASTGAGQDCSAIPGAWNVGCEQGSCKVYTCAQGYKLAQDGKSCDKL
ncbi:hypothetical protein K474DRAFT_778013 [Panus rudis PR-1116 ss-1]|nr:hypothetical protein K474DRAFT_778013 [Panus rudis PR-1116 ss-1]